MKRHISFFERALEINTNVSGSDSVLVSSDYYNLAQVSYSMYQFPEHYHFQEIVSHQKKVLFK